MVAALVLDAILALLCYYTITALVLNWRWTGHEYCTLVLRVVAQWCYTGSVRVLYWCSTWPALLLHWRDTGTAKVLHWYFTGSVLVLYESCNDTAVVLQ